MPYTLSLCIRTAMPALTWTARILAILMTVLFAAFAFDTGVNGSGPGAPAIDILMNALPAIVCGVALLVAWHKENLGGLLFSALAVAYILLTRQRPDWAMVIGAPLLLIGALFLASARMRRRAT